LVYGTLKAAGVWAAGSAAAPAAAAPAAAAGAVIPAQVAALAKGVMRTMALKQLKSVCGWALGAILLAGAAGMAVSTPPEGRAPNAGGPQKKQAPAEDTLAREKKALQGAWGTVEVQANGKKNVSAEAKDIQIVFEADAIIFRSASGGKLAKGREFYKERMHQYKLDPGKSPKQLDVLAQSGQEEGQTIPCIYALTDKQLKLCMPKEPGKRPTEFATRDGDGLVLIILERVKPKPTDPDAKREPEAELDPRPKDAAEAFADIQWEWRQAQQRFHKELERARTPAERRWIESVRAPNAAPLAEHCVRLAGVSAERPADRAAALAALWWAAGNAPDSIAGKQARAILENGAIAAADLDHVHAAIGSAWVFPRETPWTLAPHVLERAKQQLDHPKAAALLTWVCVNALADPTLPERSAVFAQAAELIAARFGSSPDIASFCECLGGPGARPAWAWRYERHLRGILEKNAHRRVRAAAQFALARVVQSTEEARQAEAEQLFEQFLSDFDGKDTTTRNVEELLRERARAELKGIRARGKAD
jgi:uncharacterized protein (TIGR03067 family)